MKEIIEWLEQQNMLALIAGVIIFLYLGSLVKAQLEPPAYVQPVYVAPTLAPSPQTVIINQPPTIQNQPTAIPAPFPSFAPVKTSTPIPFKASEYPTAKPLPRLEYRTPEPIKFEEFKRDANLDTVATPSMYDSIKLAECYDAITAWTQEQVEHGMNPENEMDPLNRIYKGKQADCEIRYGR